MKDFVQYYTEYDEVCHVPTDGEAFEKLNELAQEQPEDI